MEYTINLMSAELDPVEWARRREAQGWHALSAADHFTTGRAYPHVWVTASAMAVATSTVRITTAFVNNLFRSPVEVAQAALDLQMVSGGRFELGLGAGWLRDEMVAAGLEFPEPRDRAGAFIESAQIVRSLLHTGACSFQGDYYTVDLTGLGPVGDTPPPLVCSVGGPRTIREVTPHADRVELKAASPGTRGGAVDLPRLAAIPDGHLVELIDRVRAVDPDIEIGIFLYCAIGEDSATQAFVDALGDGLYARFSGPPGKVHESMAWLEDVGVTQAQISALHDDGLDLLAAAVL